MELIFLGTGAGCGVPTFYCGCEVCKEAAAEPRYQRTRSAIALKGSENVLFDAPPELASQLHRECIDRIDQFVLTHAHHDHTAGLHDLEIYARFHSKEVLPAVMSRETCAHLEESFHSLHDWMEVTFVEPGDCLERSGIRLTALAVSHASGTLGYLIEQNGSRVAYLPDTGPLPSETKALLKGIDDLILDATFWGENWYPEEHHTFEETIRTGEELEAGRLYLTHLSMHYSTPVTSRKIEETIDPYNGKVHLAHDGLRLEI